MDAFAWGVIGSVAGVVGTIAVIVWAGEAIALHERTLADRERVQGESHPDTLASRNILAAAYDAAGRPAEAQATRGSAASPR